MRVLLGEAVARLASLRLPRGDPSTTEELIALLRFVYEVGRHDLPLGRLLEGHVDAVQIVSRYGTDIQRTNLGNALDRGATLGMWNAGLLHEPLRLSGDQLSGGKSFASGAGVISHALVTADVDDGSQLLLLDLDRTPPSIDRSWWRMTGMQRTETHIVRWSNAVVSFAERIGPPGVYSNEPWFSGGALRYIAVHAGGVAALLDFTRAHLLVEKRATDPHQMARLANLYALAATAASIVHATAQRWFDAGDAERLPQVAAARLAVVKAADEAMVIAREAVGVQAAFVDHPLAAGLADLSVYLRQPGIDAQRIAVAAAVADGRLTPQL